MFEGVAEGGVPIESAGGDMERILEGLEQQAVSLGETKSSQTSLVELGKRTSISLHYWHKPETRTAQLSCFRDLSLPSMPLYHILSYIRCPPSCFREFPARVSSFPIALVRSGISGLPKPARAVSQERTRIFSGSLL